MTSFALERDALLRDRASSRRTNSEERAPGGIRGHARTSWRRIGSASIRDNSFDRGLTSLLRRVARSPPSRRSNRASPARRLLKTGGRLIAAIPRAGQRGPLRLEAAVWYGVCGPGACSTTPQGALANSERGACPRRTTPFSTTTVSRPTCRRGSTSWSGRSGAFGFGVFSVEVRRELDYVVFRALWSCSEPPGP